MAEFDTKNFGKINITEDGDTCVTYANKEININFFEYNIYYDKIKTCLEIIDKYLEINIIAKNIILENFPENANLREYFEYHFDDCSCFRSEEIFELFGVNNFEEMDIKKVIENFNYPNLTFYKHNDYISFSMNYTFPKISDEMLLVIMDEKFNLIDFSREKEI